MATIFNRDSPQPAEGSKFTELTRIHNKQEDRAINGIPSKEGTICESGIQSQEQLRMKIEEERRRFKESLEAANIQLSKARGSILNNTKLIVGLLRERCVDDSETMELLGLVQGQIGEIAELDSIVFEMNMETLNQQDLMFVAGYNRLSEAPTAHRAAERQLPRIQPTTSDSHGPKARSTEHSPAALASPLEDRQAPERSETILASDATGHEDEGASTTTPGSSPQLASADPQLLTRLTMKMALLRMDYEEEFQKLSDKNKELRATNKEQDELLNEKAQFGQHLKELQDQRLSELTQELEATKKARDQAIVDCAKYKQQREALRDTLSTYSDQLQVLGNFTACVKMDLDKLGKD